MRHISSRHPTRRLSRWMSGAPVSRAPHRSRRSRHFIHRLLALGLGAGLATLAAAPEAVAQDVSLRVGDKAPMFPNPLPSTAGESAGAVKLDLQAALGKKNIVLAFYVADWTGG